jgi:hypothetical protein
MRTFVVIQDFLPYVETLLRIAVTKAGVDAASLSRILHISGSLFRRIEPREQAFLSNHILVTFLQTVSEALTGKLRIAPSTLAASAQVYLQLLLSPKNLTRIFRPSCQALGLRVFLWRDS